LYDRKEKIQNGAPQAPERRKAQGVLPAALKAGMAEAKGCREESGQAGDEMGERNPSRCRWLGLARRLGVCLSDDKGRDILPGLKARLCGLIGVVTLAFEARVFSL